MGDPLAEPSAASHPSPWPQSAAWRVGGLEIGGLDATQLAAEYGTPLLLMDADEIAERMRSVSAAYPRAAYAVKAFTCHAVIRIALHAGLDLLCASGGEVEACVRAGAPAARILLHGNAKTDDELELAVRSGVGLVVADGADELARLDAIASKGGVVQPFLLRVIPDVAVQTHEAIATGHELSKFGTSRATAVGVIAEAARRRNLRYAGLHAHAGSQLLDEVAFTEVVDALVDLARELVTGQGLATEIVDAGGGFGVTYVDEAPVDPANVAPRLLARLHDRSRKAGIEAPALMVEPGRSLVANAAVTLYRVVAEKQAGGRTLVAVDGGMSDNLRPMLYDAAYAVAPAVRRAVPLHDVTVVGRHCESGDVLARSVPLPADLAPGDLVVFAATGAYGYSLASGYNRIGRPAVVAIRGGRVERWVRREDAADLDRLEVPPVRAGGDAAVPPAGCDVRPATVHDAAGVSDLWAAVVSEGEWIRDDVAPPLRAWRRRFRGARDDQSVELVAVQPGRVVGHLGISRERHPSARHVATLAVVVAADRRGRGIGAALLAEGIRWARSIGVAKLVLSVYPSNRRAIALYRRFGLVEEGRLSRQSRKPYGYADEILLARWVGDDP
jgi:diaminopimelate decarboxylase